MRRTKPIWGRLAMIGTLALLVTRPASAEEDGGCRRDAKREAWLERQAERWHRRLLAFEGYERPERFAICFARGGGPRVDYRRDRIFLRRVDENEDRISLAHEYLHLAFKNHPVSRDEGFIEGLARRLVLEGDRYEDNPDY